MDALLVTIESEYVEERSGVSVKTGKPWSISNQFAWAFMTDPTGVADKHPTKIKVTLAEGQKPYKVGNYFLHTSSFYRGDYDRLDCTPRLHPVLKAA